MNAEWNLEDRGTARVAFVPTQAERNGDFSGTPSCGCNPIPTRSAHWPAIPEQSDSGGPHQPGGPGVPQPLCVTEPDAANGCCNNWVTSVTSPIDYRQFSGRADWTLSNATR